MSLLAIATLPALTASLMYRYALTFEDEAIGADELFRNLIPTIDELSVTVAQRYRSPFSISTINHF